MSKNHAFSPEVRERAVRLAQEHRDEYPSQWAAVESIAPKIGYSGHTLLKWVQLQEVVVMIFIDNRRIHTHLLPSSKTVDLRLNGRNDFGA